MATNISDIQTFHDGNRNISSIKISGETDRTNLLQLTIKYPNNSHISIPVRIQDSRWEKQLIVNSDFIQGSLNCDDIIEINIEFFDANVKTQELDFPVQRQLNCNKCFITIEKFNAEIRDPSGDGIVTVEGTANICTSIDVHLTIDDGRILVQRATFLNDNFTWIATFSGNIGSGKFLSCDQTYQIEATCNDDNTCSTIEPKILTCNILPPTHPCEAFSVDVEVEKLVAIERFQRRRWRNPVVGDLQCMSSGYYKITVIFPQPGEVLSYQWYRNNEILRNEIGSSITIFILFQKNVSYKVRVVKKNGCGDSFEVIFSCGTTSTPGLPSKDEPVVKVDPRPDLPTPTAPVSFCDLCCMWLIANIFLTIASMLSLIIAGCVFQWIEPISLTIAIILVIITFISWILWGIFCLLLKPIRPPCESLLLIIEILDWIEFSSGVIAGILAGIGLFTCAISFGIIWGLVGTIRRFLTKVAQLIGCLPNPFFAFRRTIRSLFRGR